MSATSPFHPPRLWSLNSDLKGGACNQLSRRLGTGLNTFPPSADLAQDAMLLLQELVHDGSVPDPGRQDHTVPYRVSSGSGGRLIGCHSDQVGDRAGEYKGIRSV